MSARADKGFFAAYYDRVAAGAGALALVAAVAYCFLSGGQDPEEAAADAAAAVRRMRPAENGVAAVDMIPYDRAVRLAETPPLVATLTGTSASFLASERRVFCHNPKCRRAIPGDVKAFPKCPFCGEKQEEEKQVVLDADGDGMPDEWEKKHGFNPGDSADADVDADGDGFTNLEEFLAGTDPKDPDSHPDYLDSLRIVPPLVKVEMPFVFTKATKIPAGWRCEFLFPRMKDDYGRLGRTFTAVVGEDIGDAKRPSGFTLKSFEKKEDKRARKGMKGMTVTVDVSEVVVVRKSDGKSVTLVLAQDVREKPADLDVKVALAYERGGLKTFEAVPGSTIKLNRDSFKVESISSAGKAIRVVFRNERTGAKKTLQALEEQP